MRLVHGNAGGNTEIDHSVYLQFQGLAKLPGVWHAVFPRYRLDESGDRIPFNLGLNGDAPQERIWADRRRVMQAAGARLAVFAHQVHGVQVGVWDSDASRGRKIAGDHIRLTGDALVSNVPGAALFIQTADCQSIVMIDPVRRVVANVHSGWRGSIGNIISASVDVMSGQFGCDPADIHCGVGPSLGPCCAEFVQYKKEIPAQYWPYRRPGDLFDFWRISVDQLTAKGVARNHIEISTICTLCNQHLFYSYRGEGARAGRFAAVVVLR